MANYRGLGYAEPTKPFKGGAAVASDGSRTIGVSGDGAHIGGGFARGIFRPLSRRGARANGAPGMDCNGTDVCGGLLVALPMLLDLAANRARPGSFVAALLRTAAATMRGAAGALHTPLIGKLARVAAALARPLVAG